MALELTEWFQCHSRSHDIMSCPLMEDKAEQIEKKLLLLAKNGNNNREIDPPFLEYTL